MIAVLFSLMLTILLALTPNLALAKESTDSPSAVQVDQTTAQEKAGKTIEILTVVNQGEIAAAQVALKRSQNTQVKEFAEHMIQDHGKNLATLKKLSTDLHIMPVASDKSKEMEKKNAKLGHKLMTVSQGEFDKTYMDAMVKGHQKVLNALQDKLIPETENPRLKNALEATSQVVSHHLEMAKEVQKEVKHS
ncbi:MAG: DUF4142 domain-containing protein [Gammaproteobacteria bacterium]